MRSLTDFLGNLPGVAPRKARRLILDEDLLSEALQEDLHERFSYYGSVVEVGPDAAAAILQAYKDGRLPMQKGARPGDAPDAEAYLAQGDKWRAHIAETRRREAAVKDPSLVIESDLTDDSFVDRVFMANKGPGSGSMVLAGITVHKSIAGYKSNSGKSTGWAVHFSWTGSDGVARSCGRTPPEAENRRNDAERNWGLPE